MSIFSITWPRAWHIEMLENQWLNQQMIFCMEKKMAGEAERRERFHKHLESYYMEERNFGTKIDTLLSPRVVQIHSGFLRRE